jgi:hypothetical protein
MKKPNLNTIIAENLKKTAHVPSRGLGSLPNKKATVPFVSDQGYKNGLPPAGTHYRIPSDTLYNPTPYRIKATPNNGPSQWLEAYDTNGTQFPGANYVDEQHFQNGGVYMSDKAKATQFGQYRKGGGMFPEYHSFAPPRMANGGDPSIPDLNEYQIGGWLGDIVKYAGKKIGNTLTHTDPIDLIPYGSYLPANAKAFTRFAAANIGLGKGVPFVKKEDLTPNQLKAIKQAALNAQKRTGNSTGGTKYSDYGKNYSHVWSNPSRLLTDPVKVAQTTVGRSNYKVNPNNQINISDNYDFANEISVSATNPLNRLVHSGLKYLDSNIPEKDPRRNINFDLYKEGGSTDVGQVTTQTTNPNGGVIGTFLKNVAAIKQLFSSDDNKTPKETIKAVDKLKKDYVSKYGKDYIDLMEAYGLNPFSKEGIIKAQELSKTNPKTRIVCTAAGCSEIAVNAASAFGYNYNRGHAWDLGNSNKVVATNPVYADQIGKGILTNPTSYTAPEDMFQTGAIIALNRKNTSQDNVRAKTTNAANDSWDYANQTLYPKSRGNEHVGYMLDANTMLHGTGAHDNNPAYYMIDNNMSDGVSLPGNLKYQPVETIMPGSRATAATKGVMDTIKGWLNKDGGQPCYDCGGWLSQYADEGLEVTTQTTRSPIDGTLEQSEGKYAKKTLPSAQNGRKTSPGPNLNLPKYKKPPKGFFTGFGFSQNVAPLVNVHGVGGYGEYRPTSNLTLTGSGVLPSVVYPGGSNMFVNPSVNIGMKYKFENGGEMKYYQEGLDWQPKTISKNGGWLDSYL